MQPSRFRFCPTQHRARLVAGCLAVLLGGAGLSAHPALPHIEHGTSHTCAVCLHLEANPPVPATAPVLPAPRAKLRPAAAPRPLPRSLTPVPARGRDPPAAFTVS
ncbi:MAG: hypothetical protein R6X35_05280 [Candidatus Krumholzibacteriia bacterium]